MHVYMNEECYFEDVYYLVFRLPNEDLNMLLLFIIHFLITFPGDTSDSDMLYHIIGIL